jgi:hypothetical protein
MENQCLGITDTAIMIFIVIMTWRDWITSRQRQLQQRILTHVYLCARAQTQCILEDLQAQLRHDSSHKLIPVVSDHEFTLATDQLERQGYLTKIILVLHDQATRSATTITVFQLTDAGRIQVLGLG